MEPLIITPKTKIFDLLAAYPQLENVLISMAPQFQKLKNPVLRKTITKIASLSQAATIGGLKVEDLINRLRSEVGQNSVETIVDEGNHFNTDKPDWFDESRVSSIIDIRDMLNAGEQPVHEVLSSIRKLKDDEILKVIAPFIPAPLIDKATSIDCQHWLCHQSGNEYWVFFKN